MNDKELLEMAAKAAGIKNHAYYSCPFSGSGINTGEVDEPLWNPLTDDGDALRLAVKLDLSVDPTTVGITVGNFRTFYKLVCYEPCGNDPYVATRRAIVRAAAEIGKTL